MASIRVEIKKKSRKITKLIKTDNKINHSMGLKQLESRCKLIETEELTISSIKSKFYSNCPLEILEFRLLKLFYIRLISSMRLKPLGYKMRIINSNEKLLRYFLDELREMGLLY